jgi:YVTN family beta-propeller protein
VLGRMVKAGSAVTATLVVSGLASLAVQAHPGAPALAAATAGSSVAYIASYHQNLVTPVNTVTRRTGLPVKVGIHPDAIAITPDGRTAYVACAGSDTVVPVDTATGKAGLPIKVGIHPDAIAITADGRTAYVADNGSADVTPINLADNRAGPAVPAGQFPRAIAITPDGSTAYVVGSDTVTPIQTRTNRPLRPIRVGRNSRAIAITPDGATAYVLSTHAGSVTPIRTAGNSALPPVKVGGLPRAIVISPDGQFAYVTVSTSTGAGFVVPISTGTNTARSAVRVGARPSAIAITPDGKTVYVANQNGSVTPIRTATDTALPAIGVGLRPDAIAVAPAGGLAYVISDAVGHLGVIRGRLTIISTATGAVAKQIGMAAGPVAIGLAAPPGPVTIGTARLTPLCNNVIAPAPTLRDITTRLLDLPEPPFGIAVTPDGRWDLVAGDNFVTVLRNTSSGQHVTRVIKLPQGHSARGDALTPNGKYLLVADLRAGADVIDVARAVQGKPHPVLGTLNAPQPAKGAFEIAFSADGRFAFVTIAGDQRVAVFNLSLALTRGFGPADYVGSTPAGKSNVGIAISPDHRWLYVTSEESEPGIIHGELSVLSVRKAETDPAASVVTSVNAGCRPVRVIASPDGKTVWVTARQSNALLAFSAQRLLTDPRHALITWLRVGVQPIGLVTANCGAQIVIADSHRFKSKFGPPSLAVVDVHAALTGHQALAGYLQSGVDPRELAVTPDGRTLLVSNFGSGQLETVNLTKLNGASRTCPAAAGQRSFP